MSPQYTGTPITSSFNTNSRPSYSSSTKARKLLQMQHEDPRYRSLDRMLARAYIELVQKQKAQQKQKAGFFAPRMDLCDDPENTHIVAMLEVPGMKPEQLSVRIEGSRLIIEGERTGPLHARNQTTMQTTRLFPPSEPNSAAPPDPEASAPPPSLYPVRELKYGKFKREINLPAGVNATHVRSTLVEGMLTISWPRDPTSPAAGGSPAAHVIPHASHTNASV
ncbi:hypothetical protein LXA43DRAFT_972539 [Ganoderma leucocontextum]|nr:hypothetical protein LXA43DRAFT_972539 [Ganoderma leucocontextum]